MASKQMKQSQKNLYLIQGSFDDTVALLRIQSYIYSNKIPLKKHRKNRIEVNNK